MKLLAYSEQGGRENQLDIVISLVNVNFTLLGILDGMGDEDNSFIKEFENFIRISFFNDDFGSTEDLYDTLWSLVRKSARKCRSEGKCCAIFVLVSNYGVAVGHCGDCRAYFLDRNRVTKDHSLAFKNSASKKFDHEYVSNHPLRNRVTKVITKSKQNLDVVVLPPLSIGERVVLCSDGWWRNLTHADIWGVEEQELETLVAKTATDPKVEVDNVSVLYAAKE